MNSQAHDPGGDLPAAGAESIYADFRARRDAGQAMDFEDLLRAHPSHGQTLRLLHADFLRFAQDLDRLVPGALESDENVEGFVSAFRRGASPRNIDPDVLPPAHLADDLVARLSGNRSASKRYEFLAKIGRGGQGIVLKVWDRELGRVIALKRVMGRDEAQITAAPPHIEPEILRRFLDEAQITSQLDHPSIVPVHEIGVDSSGRAYFTMQWIRGTTFQQLLSQFHRRAPGATLEGALTIVLRVCEAVSYAHSRGVIHRDLKPDNIMVGPFGEVFVMDWGLARVRAQPDRMQPPSRTVSSHTDQRTSGSHAKQASHELTWLTSSGDLLGTPEYFPPEQAQGGLEGLDERCDVYALGATLQHLLSGAPRHADACRRLRAAARGDERELAAGVAEFCAILRTRRVPRLRFKHVPAELAAIVEQALEPEAGARYASTQLLADDLRAFLEGRVVAAHGTGAWTRARKWVRRNAILTSAAAVVVAALGSGIYASTSFAADAEDARKATTSKNVELERTNRELAVALRRADENAAEALRQRNDVLSLATRRDLERLIEDARELWPPGPALVSRYDDWLERAKNLVDGQPGNASLGLVARPGLADYHARLESLRGAAHPITPEQVDADRRGAKDYGEWIALRGHLKWMRQRLGLEPWPDEALIEAEIAREGLLNDAKALSELATIMVNMSPETMTYGNEIKGLILARRAVAVADTTFRPVALDAYSAALARVGRIEEALVAQDEAIASVAGTVRDMLVARRAQRVSGAEVWSGEGAKRQHLEAQLLEVRLERLQRSVHQRRTYVFSDQHMQWWHDELQSQVTRLQAFVDETSGLYSRGVTPDDGWGVLRRADFARSIEERSTCGADALARWDEAIASIAHSDMYGGLVVTPQVGLLPIGQDPCSQLWEFVHLQSGTEPQRAADRSLSIDETTGIVLVLVPAATFWMGASARDAHADGRNTPAHPVQLDAFFISKYEMTQAQWTRTTGRNPSAYPPMLANGTKLCSFINPVEQVSWIECDRILGRLGLTFPTEAQWEYAARAGTSTSWWTGNDASSIQGAANLSDADARAQGGPDAWALEEWLHDGWLVHAHVGTYRANAFGLHDTIGNVLEWCRDQYGFYALPTRRGDGERIAKSPFTRVARGGSFDGMARSARSAYRGNLSPDDSMFNIGVRPARALVP